MFQQEIQNTGAESVSRAGGLDHAAQRQAGLKHPQPLIICDASLRARGHIDQLQIRKLSHQLGGSSVKIGLSGDKKQLIVGNLHHIALSKAPVNLLFCLLQTSPQRWAQVWIKREDTARRPGQSHRLLGSAAHGLAGERQRTKVEDLSPGDHLLRHLVRGQKRIRPGVPVEGKVPVSVFCCFDKRQCGVAVRVHHQTIHGDARLRTNLAQKVTKLVVSYLSDKRRPLAQLGQHSQHVAGRTSGVGLIEGISLRADSVAGEVHQQLTQSSHINAFLHASHRLLNH